MNIFINLINYIFIHVLNFSKQKCITGLLKHSIVISHVVYVCIQDTRMREPLRALLQLEKRNFHSSPVNGNSDFGTIMDKKCHSLLSLSLGRINLRTCQNDLKIFLCSINSLCEP